MSNAQLSSSPFSSVLVANRGEIALRVFRSARDLGLECFAVFVDADAGSPFVREADAAVRLATGYLDGDAVITAAKTVGAEAVHPGYGFLSENAAFAQSVMDAGLVWVGPPPAVIASMGDKLAAKRLAIELGVPTLPSTDNVSAADSVGYPLLVKAAAGGGGKGMRIVPEAAELAEAVAAAKREALHGFGDDTVFLERFIARARHIEIQILGDSTGGLVHLGERECSIQRRHQKVIEESPSPVVDEGMRQAMGDAALALARALEYRSAGTVEFVVDDDERKFYFLETNTRLQVEHAVSEEVTGIDLVREQLRIAAGESLGYGQSDVTLSGHAIEARLYAEDPASDFLPQTGTLHAFESVDDPAIRWDCGVKPGSVVGVQFDPMLAKVIAHGPTRSEAARRLARALEQLHVGGVSTNRDFLAATLRTEAFQAGDTTTNFIERVQPTPRLHLSDSVLHRAAAVAALWLQEITRDEAPVLPAMPSGFRVSRMPAEHSAFQHDSGPVDVRYRKLRDRSFSVSTTGPDPGSATDANARVLAWSPDRIDVEIDGVRTNTRITKSADAVFVQVVRGTVELTLKPRFELPSAEVQAGAVAAPMPGVVLDVRCKPGDEVVAGATLVVLEAMKMEHHMDAPTDGVIAEISVAVGDQVANGQVLVLMEAQS